MPISRLQIQMFWVPIGIDHYLKHRTSTETCPKTLQPSTSTSNPAESSQQPPTNPTPSEPSPPSPPPTQNDDPDSDTPLPPPPPPLRPLTSLNWPYIPDTSSFPDPLKRDDPKPLQHNQYLAIATSPAIRSILASHPNLKSLLKSLDEKRGPEREYALERALGVTERELKESSSRSGAQRQVGEDVLALRELAEAVESAVRGENKSALGLDWGD
ncbi:hypothetical protein AX16_008250 [Volvariella volvacea WC 439]|nr:hypothetical protein AX16_008250 [Volvariella volvacea WC 439]